MGVLIAAREPWEIFDLSLDVISGSLRYLFFFNRCRGDWRGEKKESEAVCHVQTNGKSSQMDGFRQGPIDVAEACILLFRC